MGVFESSLQFKKFMAMDTMRKPSETAQIIARHLMLLLSIPPGKSMLYTLKSETR